MKPLRLLMTLGDITRPHLSRLRRLQVNLPILDGVNELFQNRILTLMSGITLGAEAILPQVDRANQAQVEVAHIQAM